MTTDCGRRSCSLWISSAAVPSSSRWSGEDPLRPCTLAWLRPHRGPFPTPTKDCPVPWQGQHDHFPYSSTFSRSIRHLQDASGTDGKGEDPLLKFVPALLSL